MNLIYREAAVLPVISGWCIYMSAHLFADAKIIVLRPEKKIKWSFILNSFWG